MIPTVRFGTGSRIRGAGVAVLVGLGPAVQTTRVDLTSSLKTSDRSGAGRTRLTARSVLVALQVALSLTLLTVTVFAIHVFRRELAKGPGWRATRMAIIHVDAGQAGYTLEDVVTADQYQNDLLWANGKSIYRWTGTGLAAPLGGGAPAAAAIAPAAAGAQGQGRARPSPCGLRAHAAEPGARLW